MTEAKAYEEMTLEEKNQFLEETLNALSEEHEDTLEDLRAIVCYISDMPGIIPAEGDEENEQTNLETNDRIEEILRIKFQNAVKAGYRGDFEAYKKLNEKS